MGPRDEEPYSQTEEITMVSPLQPSMSAHGAQYTNRSRQQEDTSSPHGNDGYSRGPRPEPCWGLDPSYIASVQKANKEAAEPMRPEVKAQIDRLVTSNCMGIAHTTRGIPQVSVHEPQPPQPFAAGRFHSQFQETSTDEKTALVIETETGVGHLGRVVPGQTDVGSNCYVALCSNPDDPWNGLTKLNRSETEHLINSLYDRFQYPMTDDQAQKLEFNISAVMAVQYSGQGAAAVSARHRQGGSIAG